MGLAIGGLGMHAQWCELYRHGAAKTLAETFRAVFVHEETGGAEIHTEYGEVARQKPVQGMQQEAVTA